ncbi:MAG TPA: hypothetical protein VE442_17090 [Jatrophihabitans sp.]|nr:hypothetical protein [Jatrophihabitans sp.]
MTHKVNWKAEPEQHDFPAAADYLSLLTEQERADVLVDRLRSAPTIYRKAKDILRAAQLPLLPEDNPHVAGDLDKIDRREPLSPVLLVRGELGIAARLEIADGYHRVCASYYVDENTDIPCRVASR